MRVISRSRLRQFWESRGNDAEIARRSLLAWEKLVRGASWAHWGDLKQTFGSADRVGNCTVFDVGNNRFRLIARVIVDKGRVFVLKVMDHEQYDRKDPRNPARSRWEDECGCHRPPPRSNADRGGLAGRN
ncbi:type II toxin-antitoxin system HigB family toxin [Aquisphaera insulae]|uniref:type II toxin-antitoxin system HigB family toxin n=1 Tax=Aquisphaera insulae TaxID=2712864 RepID=UPI0013EE2ADF|nr:type II toxin-antitoxin system HigB family toxin [Aquisphaera insulae]